MAKQKGVAKAGKAKRKPSTVARIATMRWLPNKRRRIARAARLKAKHEAKHLRRGTLGFKARKLMKAQEYKEHVEQQPAT
jgi:hypothetical protein